MNQFKKKTSKGSLQSPEPCNFAKHWKRLARAWIHRLDRDSFDAKRWKAFERKAVRVTGRPDNMNTYAQYPKKYKSAEQRAWLWSGITVEEAGTKAPWTAGEDTHTAFLWLSHRALWMFVGGKNEKSKLKRQAAGKAFGWWLWNGIKQRSLNSLMNGSSSVGVVFSLFSWRNYACKWSYSCSFHVGS